MCECLKITKIGQSAAKNLSNVVKYNKVKVQRLFRKEVHSSGWKHIAPTQDDDIV